MLTTSLHLKALEDLNPAEAKQNARFTPHRLHRDHLESTNQRVLQAQGNLGSQPLQDPEFTTKSQNKEVKDFEWSIHELKVLMDLNKEAMSLKDDLDLIKEFGDGAD
ncbi:hypothetical protein TB2_032325 [Malus domestica]